MLMNEPKNVDLICCPFHGERSPSLFIREDKTFKCLGCGKTGTYTECDMSYELTPSE